MSVLNTAEERHFSAETAVAPGGWCCSCCCWCWADITIEIIL